MKKYWKRIFAFVFILVVTLTVLITQRPIIQFTGDWFIEVGDELDFSIEIRGYDVYPPTLVELNNIEIKANITSLPNLSLFFTAGTFISGVVDVIKVSCTFSNGSEIDEAYEDVLNSLISRSILPIGFWEQIDFLYADDYDHYYVGFGPIWTWVSRVESDLFFFAHQSKEYHGSEGWKTHVNMTTGLPVDIELYEDFRWGSGPEVSSIVLVLIGYTTGNQQLHHALGTTSSFIKDY